MKWKYFKKMHLEKSLDTKRKKSDGQKQRNTISEIIDENYFRESEFKFPISFVTTSKLEYNAPQFIPTNTKKKIQYVRLEYGFFSHIFKIKITEFVKTTNIIQGKQPKCVQIVKDNKVVEVDDTKSTKFKFEG